MNKQAREERRNAMLGGNNPRWNGGNSDYPNHVILKKIRIKVLQKSKGKCEICGNPAQIVHHIDEDKSNHSIDNLIALCHHCHVNLHRDNNGKSHLGRPNKCNLEYNLPVKEIAKMFGVTSGAVYYWIRNPKKKEWLTKELDEINSKLNLENQE